MAWAPDYMQLQPLKDYLSIQDNSADVFLAAWITTVSRNVDDFTGRQFGQVDVAEDRFYRGVWDRHERALFITIDDVQDVTGLTVTDPAGNLVDSSTYHLIERNAAARGVPYGQVRIRPATPWGVATWWGYGFGVFAETFTVAGHEFTVHAKYGWTQQPAAVSTGMWLQAARLAARRDSPFGISGSPQEQGEIRLLAQLDPDFRTSLKPLQRTWWAG